MPDPPAKEDDEGCPDVEQRNRPHSSICTDLRVTMCLSNLFILIQGPNPEDGSQRREVTPKAEALAAVGISTPAARPGFTVPPLGFCPSGQTGEKVEATLPKR